jgi:hypothetical protein
MNIAEALEGLITTEPISVDTYTYGRVVEDQRVVIQYTLESEDYLGDLFVAIAPSGDTQDRGILIGAELTRNIVFWRDNDWWSDPAVTLEETRVHLAGASLEEIGYSAPVLVALDKFIAHIQNIAPVVRLLMAAVTS